MVKPNKPAVREGRDSDAGSEYVSAEDEHELWALLNQVRDTLIRLRDREVKSMGLTSMQGGVLWVLRTLEKEGVPATPAEISRRLFRQPPTTLALLNRMVKLGMITTTSIEGRRVLVALTDKGRKAYREFATRREAIPRVIASLSNSERRQLTSSLVKLRRRALEEMVVIRS